jgi:hypothetical protein
MYKIYLVSNKKLSKNLELYKKMYTLAEKLKNENRHRSTTDIP